MKEPQARYKPSKKDRQLSLSVSLFLLGREELKKQFWNIDSIHLDYETQILTISVSTMQGKLGTTLQKLRKTSKPLADYLFLSRITFKRPIIAFEVTKSFNTLTSIQTAIAKIEAGKA
jgi:hypothetical protein